MVWRRHALEAITAIDAAVSEADVFRCLVDYARNLGAEMVSYHHMAPPLAPGHERINLLSDGFPEGWVATYREEKYHRIDPITSYAQTRTRPILWSEVGRDIPVADEQQAYLDALWEWLSPGDGLAIPLFGPGGRHGYVGMGTQHALEPWNAVQVRVAQMVCEAFHLRYTELRLAALPQDFELTERELAVLRLLADGHPDWMISALSGATPDAVPTLIAGVLSKMGVTDRASAIVRARGLGLVEAKGAR